MEKNKMFGLTGITLTFILGLVFILGFIQYKEKITKSDFWIISIFVIQLAFNIVAVVR